MNEETGINICNRCKYRILEFWGSSSRYDYYNSCPYSTHSHYARKACNFFEGGTIPFCPRHNKAMKQCEVHGEITVYRCMGDKPMCREVWVHNNGLKRIVDPNYGVESLWGKRGLLKYSFDIIESTKISNWE
jgi:hypothetical protein